MMSDHGNPDSARAEHRSSALTREQVRLVDRLAIERFGIPSIVLMENAGRSAADIIDRHYGPRGNALIVCGVGNNGGDGFVVARHLHNRGWTVRILVVGELERLTPDASTNAHIVRAMELPVQWSVEPTEGECLASTIGDQDVVVDALLGTGFSGEVRGPLAEWIEALNDLKKRAMVAVDVPSGLDCDTGKPSRSTIRADLTITFVAAKIGFFVESAQEFLGTIEVADIGASQELIKEARLEPHS